MMRFDLPLAWCVLCAVVLGAAADSVDIGILAFFLLCATLVLEARDNRTH